ncbi:MAG: hypothetical protein ACYCYO_02585 [Bacilli bacterium]
MIDLVIILILSWLALFGYVFGGTRTLVYVSALVGSGYVVVEVFPWLQLVGYDPAVQGDYLHWLNRILEPILPVAKNGIHPVLSAGAPVAKAADAVVHIVYRQLIAVGYALCVLFGLLMAGKSLDTAWPDSMARRSRTVSGVFVGLLAGVYLSAFTIHIIGVAAWLTHSGMLRSELYRSLLAHTWTRILTRGIVD